MIGTPFTHVTLVLGIHMKTCLKYTWTLVKICLTFWPSYFFSPISSVGGTRATVTMSSFLVCGSLVAEPHTFFFLLFAPRSARTNNEDSRRSVWGRRKLWFKQYVQLWDWRFTFQPPCSLRRGLGGGPGWRRWDVDVSRRNVSVASLFHLRTTPFARCHSVTMRTSYGPAPPRHGSRPATSANNSPIWTESFFFESCSLVYWCTETFLYTRFQFRPISGPSN